MCHAKACVNKRKRIKIECEAQPGYPELYHQGPVSGWSIAVVPFCFLVSAKMHGVPGEGLLRLAEVILSEGCDHSGYLNLRLFCVCCGMQVYEFNNSLLFCLSIMFGIHCESNF